MVVLYRLSYRGRQKTIVFYKKKEKPVKPPPRVRLVFQGAFFFGRGRKKTGLSAAIPRPPAAGCGISAAIPCAEEARETKPRTARTTRPCNHGNCVILRGFAQWLQSGNRERPINRDRDCRQS
ncbi:MAG: hypothetical protein LBT33_02315, partial [Spirochaetia bacterium]|nr:hypothetical protein [Spirochaetia bacterium]